MAQLHSMPSSAADYPGLPEVLHAALHACQRSRSIVDSFFALASWYGFDGLTYIVLGDPSGAPSLARHWTTAGNAWGARYAARGYQRLDPRVVLTYGRSVPIAWDAVQMQKTREYAAFLADASRFGIRSGVAITLTGAGTGRAVVGWDSLASAVDSSRAFAIRASLAHLALVAGFVHESMFAHRCSGERKLKTVHLSPRERECLAFAARGMTSCDIGLKLAITERTVNFHFGNILAKLGVLNRGEAIARAMATHLVTLDY
jgi:DNA-binding CsgD family transcriptional regulator